MVKRNEHVRSERTVELGEEVKHAMSCSDANGLAVNADKTVSLT
jgi:hypothetical protein